MHKNMSYRILNIGLRVGLGLVISAGVAKAQQAIPTDPHAKRTCIVRVW